MVDFLITAMCVGINPESNKYSEACNKALQAASIQSGIKPDIEKFQQKYENKIIKATGKDIWFVAVTYYHFHDNGELVVSTGFKPVSDNITIRNNKDNFGISLSWTF